MDLETGKITFIVEREHAFDRGRWTTLGEWDDEEAARAALASSKDGGFRPHRILKVEVLP